MCFVYPLLYFDLGLNWESYIGMGGFSVLFQYKTTSFQTGQEEVKERIFYWHSITKLNGYQEKCLKCLWGSGNRTLHCWEFCSQKASVTHCPIQGPNKNPWAVFNFHKGRANFSEWMGQGLVQMLLLQPKCTADVSFYVSKAFLSSIWADLTEPRSSFKDFPLSSVTVATLRSGALLS